GIVRPPRQSGGRVVPAAVVIGAPAGIDSRRPDIRAVLVAVLPVAIAIQGHDVAAVPTPAIIAVLTPAVVAVLAPSGISVLLQVRRGDASGAAGGIQPVGYPKIEAVARKDASLYLRLLVAAHL